MVIFIYETYPLIQTFPGTTSIKDEVLIKMCDIPGLTLLLLDNTLEVNQPLQMLRVLVFGLHVRQTVMGIRTVEVIFILRRIKRHFIANK